MVSNEPGRKPRQKGKKMCKVEVAIVDIAKYMGYTPRRIGSYYSLKEHDSVRIDPRKNLFVQNSTGKGGSVVDFVMTFGNMTYKEAMDLLREYSGEREPYMQNNPKHATKAEGEEKTATLKLPERDNNMKNVFAYLTKTRMIDYEIVKEMVDRKMLYQDIRKNCVFVSYEDDRPVFACMRGTNTYRKFIGDVSGCDYTHSFFIDNGGTGLIVTESVIDAMSVMNIFSHDGIEYEGFDYLCLSGVGKYENPLKKWLKDEKYEQVMLCLDADEAGKTGAADIKAMLSELKPELPVLYAPPASGKDYNDFLKAIKEGE